MMLDITPALRAPGTAHPFTHQENLEEIQVLGEVIRFPEPATITGNYNLVDEQLVISGQLRATAHASCARCLREVRHQVSVPLQETFLRLDPRYAQEEEDPWEEKLVYRGSGVDLAGLVASLVVLDLPIRFLCKKDCAGLPEIPGSDDEQNKTTQVQDGPFAALMQLLTENQEE